MSSDEIYSLGLFMARLQPLQCRHLVYFHSMNTVGAAGNSTLLVTMQSTAPINLHSSQELNAAS